MKSIYRCNKKRKKDTYIKIHKSSQRKKKRKISLKEEFLRRHINMIKYKNNQNNTFDYIKNVSFIFSPVHQ